MSIVATSGNEIVAAPIGEMVMCVYAQPWSDAVWSQHTQQVEQLSKATPNLKALFNYSPKNGPNPTQRKEMVARTKDVTAGVERVALITESVFLRGILTAFGWLMPGKKLNTYAPSDLEPCLRWLGVVAKFDHDEALRLFKEMKSRGGLL